MGIEEQQVTESVPEATTADSFVKQCEEEIGKIVKFFNDEKELRMTVRHGKDAGAGGSSMLRKIIAVHLEDSKLSFSSLVKEIFEKLSHAGSQDQSKNGPVTLAAVRSFVLSLGERISFGLTNADADVLEDDNAASLWRWEVRDLKLLPKAYRDDISERRKRRRKIAERLAALSSAVEFLTTVHETDGSDLPPVLKSKEALGSTDDEATLRAARLEWEQKKDVTTTTQKSEVASKDSPNQTIKEIGKKRRRSDPEERERLRLEKVTKRHQLEAEKEQKRKEKEEEAERKKQDESEQKRKEKEEVERKKQEKVLKRQQEDSEKEQKRKEREEADRKKQLALKKQASFMDRFLQARRDKVSCEHSKAIDAKVPSPTKEIEKSEVTSGSEQALEVAAVVVRMDLLLKNVDVDLDELKRQHISSWRTLHSRYSSVKTQRWGVRRKPKVSVYRELRLQGANGDTRMDAEEIQNKKSPVNSSPNSTLKRSRVEFEGSDDVDWKDSFPTSCPDSPLPEVKKLISDRYLVLRSKRRRLLQFDKSHRPPYYGTFSKKSDVIKPRNPLKKDPMLDYDVDSDEEWEEEDPGESLSDFENEKDEEDEKVENEDDEDSSDEFMVPDGYLSEDEGIHMDDTHGHSGLLGSSSPTSGRNRPGELNVLTLERLQKLLDNATEHALRTNHPLVVSNLGCEDETEASACSANRTEILCLEALRIRVLAPDLLVRAC